MAVRVVLMRRGEGCLAAEGKYMKPFPKGRGFTGYNELYTVLDKSRFIRLSYK